MKFKIIIKENKNIISRLKSLEQKDQAERNEYLKNYLEPFGYEKGVAKWIKDKKRQPDDVFGDKARHPEIKKIIRQLINLRKPLDEETLDVANILVIHLDQDRVFQKEFLDFLTKYHLNSGPYKSISDRISCAESGKQKYGTQDVCVPDKKIKGSK